MVRVCWYEQASAAVQQGDGDEWSGGCGWGVWMANPKWQTKPLKRSRRDLRLMMTPRRRTARKNPKMK
jgi:hypothetical protein